MQTHLRASTPIKDPIHNYVYLTIFEKAVVDHPYFQRLHFVLQNSTTYVAYPGNKNSRYIHSLGVTQVAGRLWSSAARNASAKSLREFLDEFSKFICDNEHHVSDQAHFKDHVVSAWRQSIYGKSCFHHDPFFSEDDDTVTAHEDINGYPALFLVETCWEVIRLCALLHDIGHLPMSHSFETALQDIETLFSLHGVRDQAGYSVFFGQYKSKNAEFVDPDRSQQQREYISHISTVLNIPENALKEFLHSIPLHERRSLTIGHLDKCGCVGFCGPIISSGGR